MAESIFAQQGQGDVNPDSPIRDPPEHLPLITYEELAAGNGKLGEDKPVLVGLLGVVYDVSAGRNFYGPGKLCICRW